jgi:hypothetical protein
MGYRARLSVQLERPTASDSNCMPHGSAGHEGSVLLSLER